MTPSKAGGLNFPMFQWFIVGVFVALHRQYRFYPVVGELPYDIQFDVLSCFAFKCA